MRLGRGVETYAWKKRMGEVLRSRHWMSRQGKWIAKKGTRPGVKAEVERLRRKVTIWCGLESTARLQSSETYSFNHALVRRSFNELVPPLITNASHLSLKYPTNHFFFILTCTAHPFPPCLLIVTGPVVSPLASLFTYSSYSLSNLHPLYLSLPTHPILYPSPLTRSCLYPHHSHLSLLPLHIYPLVRLCIYLLYFAHLFHPFISVCTHASHCTKGFLHVPTHPRQYPLGSPLTSAANNSLLWL